MTRPYPTLGSLTGGLRARLSELRGSTTTMAAKRGDRLFSVGDAADRLFFLHSGRVKVFVSGPDDKQCVLRIVEPGQVFGESALFAEPIRKCQAEVLEKATIDAVSREAVMAYGEQHPDLWLELCGLLSYRLRELQEQVQWLTLFEVEQRIARLLLQWAEIRDLAADDVEMRLSQRDVAGLIGATRETTSAALNRLRRKGVVDLQRRSVAVKSVDLLRALASFSGGNPRSASGQKASN